MRSSTFRGGESKISVYEVLYSSRNGPKRQECKYSVMVHTSPAKKTCLKVQVVDLPLRERLWPDVEVDLALCYTNTHLSIIHTHTVYCAPCWVL